MKGFKVTNGSLRSIIAGVSEEGGVQYEIGVKAFPAKDWGPLAVFKDLPSAKQFAYKHFGLASRIFQCFYKKSKRRRLVEIGTYGITKSPLSRLPEGTDFADYVVLEEEIKC